MTPSSRMAGSKPINQQFQEARTGTELILGATVSTPNSLPTFPGTLICVCSKMFTRTGQHEYEEEQLEGQWPTSLYLG